MEKRIRIRCHCGKQLKAVDSYMDRYTDMCEVMVDPHVCNLMQNKIKPPTEGLTSIDELVKDNRKTLEELHNKFLKWDETKKHWMCTCPICRSLEVGGDCQ